MASPELSIVIVNWNVRDYLRQCLQSIPTAVGKLTYEVMVVDNASADGSVEMLEQEFPWVRAIASLENLGFARGNNLGIQQTRGRFLALVNPDVVLTSGSLERLVQFLQTQPSAGLVGPRILHPDGTSPPEMLWFPSVAHALYALSGLQRLSRLFYGSPARLMHVPRPCDFVIGCCMVLRREALEAIGGVPADTFMYGEDMLLGYLLQRQGYVVWYDPLCEVIHHGDASANQRWQPPQRRIAKRVGLITALRKILPAPSFVLWNLLSLVHELQWALVCLLTPQQARRPHLPLIKLHLQALAGKDLRSLLEP